MMAHNPPLPAGEYWLHDINEVVNPYGIAEIGWSDPLSAHFQLELAIRHQSSLGVDWDSGDFNHQYGINTAEMRVRWYPWRDR